MPNKKPWEWSSRAGRGERPQLLPRTRLLLVCEGEKTEPNYFRQFPVADVVEIQIVGVGRNTDSLVEEAGARRDAADAAGRPFNEVWCVFDRDSFTAQNFNRALQLARNARLRTAVSNQCFELWYLLHFHFLDAGTHRKNYIGRLSDYLKEHGLAPRYEKNMANIYALLAERQIVAIRNATTLLNRYAPWKPESANPSTNVHQLVQRLNDLAE
jgi:hypothetical protein